MRSIPILTNAKPLSGYRLALRFEDGLEGVVDLSGWKGRGVFTVWDDEEAFRQVRISKHHKLEWSDDIDMDPDAMYLELIGQTFEEYARDKQVLRHTH